jgi:hypothetical protein
MKIEIVLWILFCHWICDFVLQTDKQARGKSSNFNHLINHTMTYTVTMSILIVVCGFNNYFIWQFCRFFIITLFFHTVQDFITSRINKKLWDDKKVHLFFVSVGFDQFLHFAQLIISYKLLFK